MAQTAFTATPNPSNVTATQANFPLWNLNAPASEYSALYSMDETIHIQRAIYDKIIQNFPAQFNIFRILFSKPVKYFNSDEFTWTEEAWPRPILTVASGAGAVTYPSTQTNTLTAGGTSGVAVGDSVWYEDGSMGVITTVTPATNVIVVTPLQGKTVPATNAVSNYKLVPGFPIIADGMNSFVHFDRSVTVQHTNYVAIGQRNRRWTDMTMLKYQNAGTTDYLQIDAKKTMMNAQLDAFQYFFNGTKGNAVVTYPNGAAAFNGKTCDGIYQYMKNNGSQHATSTPATLEADFRQLAFNTNYKNVGVPRFIIGTDKALGAMGKALKNPIRYMPEMMNYNMGLKEYEIESMRFVPISCPLFEERSGLFPAFFEKMLLVLDIDTIDPACMKGLMPFSSGSTQSMTKGQGGYNTYTDFWVSYAISLMMSNVDSSYYINLSGI